MKLEDLKILISNGPIDDVLTALYKLKSLDLALLNATMTGKIKERLDSPELRPLWVNKFNSLRLERNTSFQFRDSEPQSKADFYCGYVLYLAALKKKDTQIEKYEEYLQLSVSKFNSFHALQEIINTLLINIKDATKKTELNDFFTYLTNQTPYFQTFKTPGCLLLANAYFYLANYYQKLDLSDESIVCYKECWENLHLAQLLEKDSEKKIHNAYFAQGLSSSNSFGLASISTIKESCLRIASEALPAAIRASIENKAKTTFKNNFKKSEAVDSKEAVSDEIENETTEMDEPESDSSSCSLMGIR